MILCIQVGNGGSGHYVKMVHNGIEYGDMQLICEAYQIMKSVLGMQNDEIAQVFVCLIFCYKFMCWFLCTKLESVYVGYFFVFFSWYFLFKIFRQSNT